MAGTIPISVKAISADTGAELKTLITETATAEQTIIILSVKP